MESYGDYGSSYNQGLNSLDQGGPKQKIQLFISCRKLKDLDFIGKSDPFCEVYLKNDERSPWIMVMKTDTVMNNLNPDFSTPVTLDYCFEKAQLIRFEVYDQDVGSKETQGKHQTKISNLVGAKNQTYWGDLTLDGSFKSRGKIIIKTDSVKESNKSVITSVRCKGLKSKKHFLKMVASNHPFLVIKRCLNLDSTIDDTDSAVKIYSSEIMHQTLAPSWNIGEMKLETLCNSNVDLPIIYEVWCNQK